MHDLVFRQGCFAGDTCSSLYFKMLEATATVVHWERMAELKAVRKVLSDPTDIVALFNNKFVSKDWVLTRMVSFQPNGPRSFMRLIQDKTGRENLLAFCKEFTAESAISHSRGNFNLGWTIGRIALALIEQNQDYSLMNIWNPHYDDVKYRQFIAYLSGGSKKPLDLNQKNDGPLVFCIKDPLTLPKGPAFMEHVFPYLSLTEKREVLAEITKDCTFYKESMDFLTKSTFKGESWNEVFALIQFVTARSMLSGDAAAAVWALECFTTSNAMHELSSLGPIVTASDIYLWRKADYIRLKRFLELQCSRTTPDADTLIELVRMMMREDEKEWAEYIHYILQSFFMAIFYRKASTTEALNVLREFAAGKEPDFIDYSFIFNNRCHRFDSYFRTGLRRYIADFNNVQSVTIVRISGHWTLLPGSKITMRQVYYSAHYSQVAYAEYDMFALVDAEDNVVPFDDDGATTDLRRFSTTYEYEQVQEAVRPLGIDMTKPKGLHVTRPEYFGRLQ